MHCLCRQKSGKGSSANHYLACTHANLQITSFLLSYQWKGFFSNPQWEYPQNEQDSSKGSITRSSSGKCFTMDAVSWKQWKNSAKVVPTVQPSEVKAISSNLFLVDFADRKMSLRKPCCIQSKQASRRPQWESSQSQKGAKLVWEFPIQERRKLLEGLAAHRHWPMARFISFGCFKRNH